MKKFTITLIFALLVISKTWAQQISTDPANPINEERPELTNNFNWMDRILTVYHPDGGYVDGNDNPIQLGSPYFEREEYQNHFNLFNYDLSLPSNEEPNKLYFHPKDGWELLHKNNGFEPDESTLITDPLINRVGPYFMLYNRYTGKLRVLASFDGIGQNDNIVTTLKFKHPTSGAPNLVYNGLFNNYGTTSQPLDQQTNVLEISEASKAAINRGFISSDFQMSYDPCTCENQSELIVDFASLNEANMQLEGRLIATSVPLDGSGNSPLLNREDFLTQVYKDNFSVNGGMLTYKNIDALVEKYEQPELSAFEKAGIAAIKAAISGGAKAVDKNLIGPGAAIVMNDIFSDLPFYKDQKSVGLGIVAAGAKSLTAELFPEHSIPTISFIEGEMVLTGTLEDETPFNNGSINLVVPGSNGSGDVQWQFYPAYNKPLGLFALLQTPTVIKSTWTKNESTWFGPCRENVDEFVEYERYKLNTDLAYTFNNESNVNIQNTDVLGALVIKTNRGSPTHAPLSGDHFEKNLQQIKDLSNNLTFITPFVPIENLQDIVPEILVDYQASHGGGCISTTNFNRDIEIELRLLIEYEFKENSYGKINRTVQVYTYPVNLIEGEINSPDFEDLNEIQTNWESPQDLVNPQPSIFRQEAWDEITITHTVVSIPATQIGGSHYFVFKANTIHLTDGAHIGPGVTLKAGLPLPDRVEVQPKNESYVANFCNTTYRGQEYSGTISANSQIAALESTELLSAKEASVLDSLSNGVTIYPNPNSGRFNIRFEYPATSCQEVKILSTANELLYHKIVKGSINDLEINLNLPLGDNYVKFYFNEGIVTKRIWIQ